MKLSFISSLSLLILLSIAGCNNKQDPRPLPNNNDAIVSNPDLTNESSKKNVLAIVIGMSKYKYLNRLRFPKNDADSMATVLKSFNVDVIPCIDCSKEELDEAVKHWSGALKNYKVGLFYYSGHGAEIAGKNYFFPVSTPRNINMDVSKECLSLDSVLLAMYQAQTKMNLVFLDACRDNPFPTKSFFGGGLAETRNIPNGTFIGYSSAPGTVSLDDGQFNSVYTEGILKYIRKPDMTIDQIFNNVNAYVRKYTNTRQTPFKNSSLDADFYFNLSAKKDITKSLNLDDDKNLYADRIRQLFPSIPFGSKVEDVIALEYGEEFRQSVKFNDLIRAFECKENDIRYYLRKLSESSQFITLRNYLQTRGLQQMISDQSYILYQFKNERLFRMDVNLWLTDIDFHSAFLQSLNISDEKYAARFAKYGPNNFTVMFLNPSTNVTTLLLGSKDSYDACNIGDYFSAVDTVNSNIR
ncbi:MAG: caspase family protein [Chitinophagaceae bacterium]|nr:caspase family protein [Chitinophagaceae bacterium]